MAVILAGAVYLLVIGPWTQDRPHATERSADTAGLPVSPTDWRGRIDYVALDGRIREMMTDESLQGFAIAFVEDGRLSFVQGYGSASAQTGEPVRPDTVFRWASLSKTVAGALAAKLAAEGVLSLSDPLDRFDTSLRLPHDAERRLSVEQLLSQRTGLPKNAYDDRLEAGDDPAEIRLDMMKAPLMCATGTCHSYQNVAFDTISEVVAQTSGRSFDSVANDQLFRPLGMTSASFGAQGLLSAEHWARPHRDGAQMPVNDAYYRVPAAAGVNANIIDLAKWMQALMGLAPVALEPQALAEMQRPRVSTGRVYGSTPFGRALENPSYGLGVRSFSYRGHRLIGHSGAVAGYRSTMMFDPETKTGVVMLWNSEAGRPFRLQAEFFDRAYGLPFEDWLQLAEERRPGVHIQGRVQTIR